MMRNKIHNRIGNRNENRSYEEIYANREKQKEQKQNQSWEDKTRQRLETKTMEVYTKRKSVDNLPLGPVAPFALLVKFTESFKHLRKYDG